MTDVLETQGGGEALPVESTPVETTETVSQPVDRRAALEAAFSAKEAPETTQEETKADRARDERGRFAAEQKAAEEKPARKCPSSWKPEAKPLFERIAGDPELALIADEIERREADFHKGLEGYKGKAQFADAMERAIAPFAATIQSYGVSPDVAVQALFAADHRLRYGAPHEKAQALMQLAQDYGINLDGLPQQAQVDPNYAALYQELAQTKAQLNQYFAYQQQAQTQTYQSEIERFATDKPHFDAVREDMAALLQAGRAESLDQAYEMATWARPDIRSSLLEQQMKDAEQKRREDAQRAAAAAKSAAVQVRGAPTGGPSNPPVTDRRASIAAAFDRSRI